MLSTECFREENGQETATAAEMQLALLAHPHSKTKGP